MEKRSVNLCSTYILPLLGLNRWSFGAGGKEFINSYISTDDKYIVVECTNPHTVVTTRHPNFKFSMEKDGNYFAIFEIPVFYNEDVQKFKEGKYSLFSDSAKNLIKKKSGLKYKVPRADGRYDSALELLALDKAEELREYWERRINVKIDRTAELASIPGDENYYQLSLTNQLV